MPLIFVPVVVVTPVVVDQYTLNDVAPLTAAQEMVTCLVPAVAVTPVGAKGTVVAGAVSSVVAEASETTARTRSCPD